MPNWYTTRMALDASDLDSILTGGIMDFNRFIPIPGHIVSGDDGESRFFWIWRHWGTAKNAVHTEVRHYTNGLAIVQFETAWGGLSGNLFAKIIAACKTVPVIEYMTADNYDGVTAVIPGPYGSAAYVDYPTRQTTLLFMVLPAKDYYSDPEEGDWYVPDKSLDSVPDPQALAELIANRKGGALQ